MTQVYSTGCGFATGRRSQPYRALVGSQVHRDAVLADNPGMKVPSSIYPCSVARMLRGMGPRVIQPSSNRRVAIEVPRAPGHRGTAGPPSGPGASLRGGHRLHLMTTIPQRYAQGFQTMRTTTTTSSSEANPEPMAIREYSLPPSDWGTSPSAACSRSAAARIDGTTRNRFNPKAAR